MLAIGDLMPQASWEGKLHILSRIWQYSYHVLTMHENLTLGKKSSHPVVVGQEDFASSDLPAESVSMAISTLACMLKYWIMYMFACAPHIHADCPHMLCWARV